MHNVIGDALVSFIYQIKFFNKHLLQYKHILDNTILLYLSTLSIEIGILFI